MKIVLISKNCYPYLSPRAHRTTELAKAFVKLGHEVIVYSLLGNYDYSDFSKNTGIKFKNLGESKYGVVDNTGYYNRNIFYRIFGRIVGRKYFEFPLIELKSMVQRALKSESKIDYLITVAHPYPIHWGVASYIDKNTDKIKFWVADCGDPYMRNPFSIPPFYFKYLEKRWCKRCNYITIPIESAVNGYYPEFRYKIRIISQGFDFEDIKLLRYEQKTIPTFAFAGLIYKKLRDPSRFLQYLSKQNFDFKFIVYSQKSDIFDNFKSILGEKLEVRDYIPRELLLTELSKMDFLINIQNNSTVQQPSKLIDYALTQRPILNITSEFGEMNTFDEFIKNNFTNQLIVKDIQQYNIINVANKFLSLMRNN